MSIFFDFSEIYKNEYQKRIAGASIYKFLDEENLDLDYFIKEEITKENAFYIACSSMERRLFKDINFDYYKNFFIRPVGRKYQFVGDFVILKNGEAYYRVKDIYINDSMNIKAYEKEFSFEIKIRNENKKANSEITLIKNIINETRNVYDYKCLEFIHNFDNYLEFEKKYFSLKLGFYKTIGFKSIELKEIKRSLELCKKYQDYLYFDDGSNYLYVESSTSVEEQYSSVISIEFEVKISKEENKYNDLVNFISQDIEMSNEKEALENDELKGNNSELEFSFKTRRLGSLLKPLEIVSEGEKEITYSFSKFWSDEGDDTYYSFARVNDYIVTNFGVKPLLVNILNGDIALYKRGKQALKDLKEGNVKNPLIAGYLFNIRECESNDDNVSFENLRWSNASLDKYQKEAVYKAINSSSIFLLQGPPGTGKTQTITEMVYQFNKMGKKVLLSSQTHVAIDNVIERLPDELDILPIRLINSERKMKSDRSFLPDKLVDNFYDKLKNKYQNKRERFFEYSEEMKKSELEYLKIKKLVSKNALNREKAKGLKQEFSQKRVFINNLDNKINTTFMKIKDNMDSLNFFKRFKENDYVFKDYKINIIDTEVILGFNSLVKKYEINDPSLMSLNDYLKYFEIYYSNNEQFIRDYEEIIKRSISRISNNVQKIRDSMKVYEEEFERLRLEKSKESLVLNKISEALGDIFKVHKNEFQMIDNYYDFYFNEKIRLNKKPLSDEECLEEIDRYIEKEKRKFYEESIRYEEYKDIYEEIANYIEDNKDELIENDREKYTKILLNNNANVYGITCNANSKYLEEKNEYLKKLGLGNIELKNIDFDVVIIDEVSKANSIELLIPILHGKKIILVGDHRQLPPIFKYNEQMFSRLREENKVSKETLKKYESLVENSFFKELFKQAKRNKYMLVNQYRSHEQIMNVVNIFYDDKLRLGNKSEQNEAKRHHLNVNSNEYNLFSDDIHTYWFNSHYDMNRNISYEKKKRKGSIVSTSFYNEQEVFLTREILKKLDEGYSRLVSQGIVKEADSVGVISLYGDQVRELQKEITKVKFKTLNFNKKKISTVDEFQGKEEDIIIVNFVRNNSFFEAGDFVKKFERINVALSRARKMLIIVGSKQFFTNLKVKMESLDDESEIQERKIYKEVYERIKGKIDEPNNYFKEVRV